MIKYLLPILLSLSLLGSSCTSSTEYGDCVGVTDKKKDELVYEVDIGNVLIGLFFIETVVVPAYVILDELECPVGRSYD